MRDSLVGFLFFLTSSPSSLLSLCNWLLIANAVVCIRSAIPTRLLFADNDGSATHIPIMMHADDETDTYCASCSRLRVLACLRGRYSCDDCDDPYGRWRS